MRISILLTLFLSAVSLSCISRQSDTPQPTYADVAMPAKDLLAVAKTVVTSPPYNLKVEEENKGRFTTSYQDFQGDWHIVRYWPQRTRYTVTVAPDFDRPNDHSRVDVSVETVEQAAGATVNGQPKWTHDPESSHPERAAALAAAIRNAAAKQ